MGMCGQKNTSVHRKVGLSEVLCMPYWRNNEHSVDWVKFHANWPGAQKLNGSQRDSHREVASLRRVEFLIRCVASGNSVLTGQNIATPGKLNTFWITVLLYSGLM